MVTLLIFLFILSILVLIHEAGHYFVARKLGIKVEEFGFGIPPRLWGKKIGETLYSINWLPIGGFVKLYGEDEAGAGRIASTKNKELITSNKKDTERAFYARSVWQRAAVVIAGVVMNALLAVVIFYVYLFISGFKAEYPLFNNFRFFGVEQHNTTDIIIGDVAKDSPAAQIGLKPIAKIEKVNGKPIGNVREFVALIGEYKGKKMTLTWQDVKSKETFTKEVTPRKSPPKNEGALGVSFFQYDRALLSYDTPMQKVFSGFIHPANLLVYNFSVMKDLALASLKQKNAAPLAQGVNGPVGIYSLVGTIVQIPDMKERILQGLNLAGLLSISLAFFNVLPIPALDGGRLFFILFEAVTKKKVNERFETMAHTIGMVILLALILLVTFHDIIRLFTR